MARAAGTAAGPAAPGQVLGSPPLGRLPQPALGDRGEVQPAAGARTAPGPRRPSAFSVSGVASARRRCAQAASGPERGCGRRRGRTAIEVTCWRRMSSQMVRSSFFGLAALGRAALLQPEQDLGDRPRRQAAQADLAAGRSPAGPAATAPHPARGRPCGPQPHLVSPAVRAAGSRPGRGAGRHLARPARRQRPDPGWARNSSDPEHLALLQVQVRPAQRQPGPPPVRARSRPPRTAPGRATRGPGRQQPASSAAQPVRGQPQPAAEQTRRAAARWSCSRRPGTPASPAAGARPEATAPGAPGPSPPRPGIPDRAPAAIAASCQPGAAPAAKTCDACGASASRRPAPSRSPARPGQLAGAGHPLDRLAQPGRVRMQVDLRGGHRRMTEQILRSRRSCRPRQPRCSRTRAAADAA